jgi:hypothetical protein
MWIDDRGKNLLTAEVVVYLNHATGGSFTAEVLEATYTIGAIYRNGGIWLQRLQ